MQVVRCSLGNRGIAPDLILPALSSGSSQTVKRLCSKLHMIASEPEATKIASGRVEACVLVPGPIREWFRCHILRPLLRLLRGGVTPRRLAWSLAFGMVVGINPSVGLTTILVVLVAWVFGLSKLASLLGSHVVAPLHLLLFIPFIDIGVHLFHTRKLPIDRRQLEHLSHHPVRLLHEIWQWEWHALIVWGLVAAVAMPLLALYLRRALIMLLRRHRTLVRSMPSAH